MVYLHPDDYEQLKLVNDEVRKLQNVQVTIFALSTAVVGIALPLITTLESLPAGTISSSNVLLLILPVVVIVISYFSVLGWVMPTLSSFRGVNQSTDLKHVLSIAKGRLRRLGSFVFLAAISTVFLASATVVLSLVITIAL